MPDFLFELKWILCMDECDMQIKFFIYLIKKYLCKLYWWIDKHWRFIWSYTINTDLPHIAYFRNWRNNVRSVLKYFKLFETNFVRTKQKWSFFGVNKHNVKESRERRKEPWDPSFTFFHENRLFLKLSFRSNNFKHLIQHYTFCEIFYCFFSFEINFTALYMLNKENYWKVSNKRIHLRKSFLSSTSSLVLSLILVELATLRNANYCTIFNIVNQFCCVKFIKYLKNIRSL